MTLEDWIHKIQSEVVVSAGTDLSRLSTFVRLSAPVSVPVITVVGTNGKGAAVETLKNIYCSANYTVGTYTSPHLMTWNERIRINGVAVSDTVFLNALIFIYTRYKNSK